MSVKDWRKRHQQYKITKKFSKNALGALAVFGGVYGLWQISWSALGVVFNVLSTTFWFTLPVAVIGGGYYWIRKRFPAAFRR